MKDFGGIRVFHGTRLASPDDMKSGLRLLDAEEMRAFARQKIRDLECRGVTTEAIERAIATVPLDHREKRIWFCFDEQTPKYDHYCRYGSEYVKAIAIRVCAGAERRLEAAGLPFLVTCDLLWETFDEHSLHSVIKFLAFLVFETAADGKDKPRLSHRGFSIARNVPAEQIVSVNEVRGLKTFEQEEQERIAGRRAMQKLLDEFST